MCSSSSLVRLLARSGRRNERLPFPSKNNGLDRLRDPFFRRGASHLFIAVFRRDAHASKSYLPSDRVPDKLASKAFGIDMQRSDRRRTSLNPVQNALCHCFAARQERKHIVPGPPIGRTRVGTLKLTDCRWQAAAYFALHEYPDLVRRAGESPLAHEICSFVIALPNSLEMEAERFQRFHHDVLVVCAFVDSGLCVQLLLFRKFEEALQIMVFRRASNYVLESRGSLSLRL